MGGGGEEKWLFPICFVHIVKAIMFKWLERPSVKAEGFRDFFHPSFPEF